jgi:hypothetical protein
MRLKLKKIGIGVICLVCFLNVGNLCATSDFGLPTPVFSEIDPINPSATPETYLPFGTEEYGNAGDPALYGPGGDPIGGLPVKEGYIFLALSVAGYGFFSMIQRKKKKNGIL